MSTTQPRVFKQASIENDGAFASVDWALFLGISLIWGASFLLIASALEGLTPGMITLGRALLGAVTIVVLGRFKASSVKLDRADLGRFVFLSVTWVALPFTFFPLAQEHINSAVTGLLNGGVPIFAAVISTALVKLAPARPQLIGIAVGFLGVVLISLGSLGQGESAAIGIGLVLLATFCYGLSVNLAGPLQVRYGALGTMRVVLTLATLWVIPFGLWDIGDNEWRLRPILAVIALGALVPASPMPSWPPWLGGSARFGLRSSPT